MDTPCIKWAGAHESKHGRPRLGDAYAHRLRYEEAHGPLSPGLVLHHTCHNKTCVNVAHLQAMTQSEHMKLHETNSTKTRCPAAHAYDAANTGYTKRGTRYCRACARIRVAANRNKGA